MNSRVKTGLIVLGVVLVLIVVIGVIISVLNQNEPSPIVVIDQGKLQGIVKSSRSGRNFYSYFGIPYAEKPKRFEAPLEPLTRWMEDVKDASKYGPPCVHMENGKIVGDEDCLNLNVFTPNLNGTLPVMVYFHASGFYAGRADIYKPDWFLDEDIILVTFNYRLHAFGFLCTGDGEAQGNMGLKDQSMALKWVQRNIHKFGGDPYRVTIFGASAGSASVSYQILSPMSKGLFHNAIMEGGSSLNPWAINLKPTELTKLLGQRLGCSTNSGTRELIQCIKEKPRDDIAKQMFRKWHEDPHVSFAPCVERSQKFPVFLPDYPINILKQGMYNKVNVIAGINSEEGLSFHAASIYHNKSLQNDINHEYTRIFPITLIYDEDPLIQSSKWDDLSNRIKNYYFQSRWIGSNDSFQSLINMYSDRWFICGVVEEAWWLSKYTNVFPYILSYRGQSSLLEDQGIKEVYGVSHGDEVQYFFDGIWSTPLYTKRDLEFSKNIIKLWTSFAEYGTPTKIWSPPNRVWPKLQYSNNSNGREMTWLDLNEDTKILRGIYKSRLYFWNSIMKFDRTNK